MHSPLDRRRFLGTTLSAGALAFLHRLPPVSAEEVKPKIVSLTPDIEPLVRLIEDTDRAKLLEAVAGKIKDGTSYQNLLAAVQLAGVRGIKPRPVGFKFHAVLVINSAHLASIAAKDRERWLPLIWAIDNFKVSQAKNKEEGDWRMPPIDEGKVPSAAQARKRFTEAMDNWDVDGADLAVTALARTAGTNEIMELFYRYGARDFRDIGHKAIFVANSTRALHTIGWRHSEPILRSLAFALLEHEGDNPAKRDGDPDRPWRENIKRVGQIREDWQRGKASPEASADLLDTLRTAKPGDAPEKVIEILNKGVDPASVWDGLFLTAGELLMRQPGIGGLHCVTTMNALHHAYQSSANDETRRMMMLQGAAFLPMFKAFMASRGKLNEAARIDKLEKADANAKGDAVESIFSDVKKNNDAAAKKLLAVLENGGSAEPIMAEARRLIFIKGTDAHDYKFSSAALEDFYHATPAWRNRFLASSVYWLRGAKDDDNDLIRRAQAALGKA